MCTYIYIYDDIIRIQIMFFHLKKNSPITVLRRCWQKLRSTKYCLRDKHGHDSCLTDCTHTHFMSLGKRSGSNILALSKKHHERHMGSSSHKSFRH